MRRLAAILLGVLALAGAAVLLSGAAAAGSSSATFDVIFDDARGLVAGQLVKVAGAQAGTIQNVTVTADFKARIEATIDSKFIPFHQDASCTIRPEGLIAENYVECDPGSAGSAPLRAAGGQPPTVPVSHTTEPVSLLDLFGIFNAPTRQRLTVLVNTLGIATSARGQDLNYVLRRANPTLAAAQQVIGILSRQRAQLATIVDASNTIAASAAAHTPAVQSFLDRTAALTALTSNHRTALAQAVNRLPAMLAVAQSALAQLDTVAVDGTPLVNQIHAAVPALNRVSADLKPFVAAAKPGLAKLGTAVSHTIPALLHSAPLLRTLRSYADRSRSGTLLTARLFSSLQRHGFTENFFSVLYYIGASLARYDSTSHMLSILLLSPDNGLCGNYATTPVAACSAHYGSQPSSTLSAASAGAARANRKFARRQPHAHRGRHAGRSSTAPAAAVPAAGATNPSVGAGSTTATAASAAASATATPGSPTQGASSLQGLVNYLLR